MDTARSSSLIAASLYLVSLKRLIFASSCDLTRYFWTLLPFTLRLHTASRTVAMRKTMGSCMSVSTLIPSVSRDSTSRPGMTPLIHCSNSPPTPSLDWQCITACCKSSTVSWHSAFLQFGLLLGFVLATLSWVGKIWCSNLKRKLTFSGPNPDSLARAQQFSHSTLGHGPLFQPSPSPPPGIPTKSEYKYKCTKNINQWEKVHENHYLRSQKVVYP